MERRSFLSRFFIFSGGAVLMTFSPMLTTIARCFVKKKPVVKTTCSVPIKEKDVIEIFERNNIVLKRPNSDNITLNEQGSLVWGQIDGQRSSYHIAESLSRIYQMDMELIAEDVESFVVGLKKVGFLKIRETIPCYAYKDRDRFLV